jgi:hypothetical protein
MFGSLLVAVYGNLQLGRDSHVAMFYAVLFLGIALCGPGRYSVDALLFGRGVEYER